MKEAAINEITDLIATQCGAGGVFLTTTDGARPNTMTIGWGNACPMFGKGVFMAMVRGSRYSYGLLRQTGCFTVSVPLHDMKKELAFAGTKSGRDVDKFSGHGLTAAPAQAVCAPIVAECELHVECRVIGVVPTLPEQFDEAILTRWYPDRDMHTLFFGEIERCYYTDR